MKIVISIIIVFICSACFGQDTDISIEKIVLDFNRKFSSDSSLTKKIVFNDRGSILIPPNYSNKRTGTIDSERGELTGPRFVIGYDIGYMAGTHMSAHKIKECSSYLNTSVNGVNTWIGLIKGKLLVTICDFGIKDVRSFPANFWSMVNSEQDVAEALKIIFTYKYNKEQ